MGAGEFVSEIFGDEADELRRRGGDGGEFGATTGRPRRMGWFDAVASRYGCRMQGATEVALTVLDEMCIRDRPQSAHSSGIPTDSTWPSALAFSVISSNVKACLLYTSSR